MRRVAWYFDFVSPFAYLALARLGELPREVEITYRPVLFAGLLARFGQKGPAEIPAKRRWTYRWCQWQAQQLGVPFRFPAAHPFNPLQHLRLAVAAGAGAEAVRRIFAELWTTGADPADTQRFAALCRELGADEARLAAPEVKDALRRDTEQAAAAGVFGVPTLAIDGELFWGADALDFAKAFLADPGVLASEEMRRVDALPVGAQRRG
ncbi:MAG: 2-hydroxychromene-2-carboxylate isomerase [Betaproteobacteria bacterium]|nr:2-hydroxychromene-2-carboxylate isomerase [Betaproteobacteria bacterium]